MYLPTSPSRRRKCFLRTRLGVKYEVIRSSSLSVSSTFLRICLRRSSYIVLNIGIFPYLFFFRSFLPYTRPTFRAKGASHAPSSHVNVIQPPTLAFYGGQRRRPCRRNDRFCRGASWPPSCFS